MKREEILESARTCVCTDRNKQYGEPEDNFKAIAEMWMSHLKAKGYDVSITATDVALMLIEFKVARAITAKTPKSDTFIDIAGYAACGGEIATQLLHGENAAFVEKQAIMTVRRFSLFRMMYPVFLTVIKASLLKNQGE